MSMTSTELMSALPSNAGLTKSELHGLLENETRRLALKYLAEETAPVELDELTVAITTWQGKRNAADEDDLEQVRMQLHHIHLPKMAAMDVVDYDVETCEVAL